jgi:hypothetical protein
MRNPDSEGGRVSATAERDDGTEALRPAAEATGLSHAGVAIYVVIWPVAEWLSQSCQLRVHSL